MTILSRPISQVFINFRGKDTRHGFVSHLTDALKRHNIKFFIDSHELKGRDLKHLFKRIEQATIALVILSTRYGESKWCLEELRTIMEKSERKEIIVIPIFYKVRPEDVRKQKGSFGYWFGRHTEESSREKMETWQLALDNVCNKFGFTSDHYRSEAKLIKKIVKKVAKVLSTIPSDDRREDHCVKASNVPVALPRSWFGWMVGLIAATLGLLTSVPHQPCLLLLLSLALFCGFLKSWADRSD